MEKQINQILQAVPLYSREDAKKNIPYIINALRDEGILTPNVLAYALATTQAESRFQPVREGFASTNQGAIDAVTDLYNRGKISTNYALPQANGNSYYGRGFIQLTWPGNYQTMGQRIGMGNQLYDNPDLLLDPTIAAKVMAAFFKDKGVANLAEQGNFVSARGPVNGTDRAVEIAQTANYYRKSVPNKLQDVTPTPTEKPKKDIEKSKKDIWQNFNDKYNPLLVKASENVLQSTQPNIFQSTLSKSKKNEIVTTKPIPNAYTVKSGDTLWGIAEKTLGSGTRWKELGGYTGDPRQMPIGTKLTIPSQKTTSPYQTSMYSAPQSKINYSTQISKQTPQYQTKAPTPTYQSKAPTSYSSPAQSVRRAVSTPSYSVPKPAPTPVYQSRAPAPVYQFRAPAPVYQSRAPAPVYQSRAPAPVYQSRAPSQSIAPKQSKSSSIISNAINTVKSWFKW